jgi:hypothetical protein
MGGAYHIPWTGLVEHIQIICGMIEPLTPPPICLIWGDPPPTNTVGQQWEFPTHEECRAFSYGLGDGTYSRGAQVVSHSGWRMETGSKVFELQMALLEPDPHVVFVVDQKRRNRPDGQRFATIEEVEAYTLGVEAGRCGKKSWIQVPDRSFVAVLGGPGAKADEIRWCVAPDGRFVDTSWVINCPIFENWDGVNEPGAKMPVGFGLQ